MDTEEGNVNRTSEPGTQSVVVTVQQAVQDPGENSDVVFAVIGNGFSVAGYSPVNTTRFR